MTKISLEYNGQLRTKLIHDPSKTSILTDAPKDNHGLGNSFSPTDLVASALAACMITVLGIQNEERNLGIQEMSARVIKTMESNPRRISQVEIDLNIKTNDQGSRNQKLIEKIAKTCPVALSLSSELKQIINLEFT